MPFDDLLEEEATTSGIKGWFLEVPAWAEGIKKGKVSRYSNKKTIMCLNWVEARKYRKAPSGAPRWWGCPRGRDCVFAHGRAELRGDGLKAALKADKQKKQDELLISANKYCEVNEYIQDEMNGELKDVLWGINLYTNVSI